MKKSAKVFLIAVYTMCFAMQLETYAAAYIDPATTSYVIQAIAGVVIACGATVAVFWRKIKFWFKKKRAERIRNARNKSER